MKILSLSLLVVLALSTALFVAESAAEPVHNYPPIEVGPSASPDDVTGVLFVQPFTLDQACTYDWRADQPAMTSGWILAVGVTPELAEQKDTWNPVLYVGRYPADIVATDPQLGRMVVIVPGDVDLAHDPVFFGSLELPDQVTAERAGEEMQAALAAGFQPMTAEALRLASAESVQVADAWHLYAGPVADAIDSWAPAARGIAESFRVPLVSSP
jgi:hypothetical protein